MALKDSTLFALLAALGQPESVTDLVNFIDAGGSDGITALTGDVTASGAGGPAASSIALVGGQTAANVAAAALLANAATNLNTVSTIVKRDASGNVIVGVLSATSLRVGNSAASTEVMDGIATTHKIQVFDQSGTSLGYIPVYAAIT